MNEAGENNKQRPEEPPQPEASSSGTERPISNGRSRGAEPQTTPPHEPSGEQPLPHLSDVEREHLEKRVEQLGSIPVEARSADEQEELQGLSQILIHDGKIQEELNAQMGENFAAGQLNNEATEEGDIAEQDVASVQEQMASGNKLLREFLAAPNDEKLAELRRTIGDIGDSEKMSKIKRSKGVVARGLYYAWMTFLVLFVIAAKMVQGVSSVASVAKK